MKLDLRWKAAVVAAACVLALTTGGALAQPEIPPGPEVIIYDGSLMQFTERVEWRESTPSDKSPWSCHVGCGEMLAGRDRV